MLFNVTFETVTEESAQYGDCEETGFYAQHVSLREGFEALEGAEGGIEPSCSDPDQASWITGYKVSYSYETGTEESRFLHFPENITAASKRRVMRLFGIRC